MLNIKLLPAKYGDSILIEYGTNEDPHYVLIDGGTGGTKAEIETLIEQLPEGKRHFDLMVVTHIDRDHIEGLLNLLKEDQLGFTTDDFWFNGYKHLLGDEEDIESLGAKQGEYLSFHINKHGIPWNEHFGKGPVVIKDQTNLPTVTLAGGMTLTLLSPLTEHLAALQPVWDKEILEANLKPGFGMEEPNETEIESLGLALPDVEMLFQERFQEDDSEANGSSIAFLACYDNKKILLAGDAFPSVILQSLDSEFKNEKVKIDLAKLSHHGGSGNTSPALLEKLKCLKYAISTSGTMYPHPAPVTIARVIKTAGSGTELYFNYRSTHNEVWDSKILQEKYGYKTEYPLTTTPQVNGITISL